MKENNKNKNRLSSHRAWLTVLAVVFFIYSLTLILPCLWLVYNSVKTKMEFFFNPWAVPENIFANLKNYIVVFSDFGVGQMFLHTIFLAVCSPLISLFCHCCTAYAYARHRFKLKGVLYALMIVPMLVNIAGTLPTTYKLICDLGIYDNIILILVLQASGGGFNFLLIGSVFENMSNTYKEAAQMDGAGHWRIFLTIYVPQASNLLVSLYILAFINVWNDYTTPYLYLPSFPTLATGVQQIQQMVQNSAGSKYSDDWPKLFATMILSILPVLGLFIAFQDRIMTMTAGGGLKE